MQKENSIITSIPKTDLYVALASIGVAAIVVFSVTREDAFFAAPKSQAEIDKAREDLKVKPKTKDGGTPLGDPSLPYNVNQAFIAFNQANTLEKEGKHQESIEFFKKACQFDPIRKLYWSALGGAYTTSSNYEEARKAYEQVYQRDVYDTFNLNSLGYASQSLRKDPDALRYYLATLTIEPDRRDSWQELFNVMHGLGWYQFYDAVQAMTLTPNSIDNVTLVYRLNQTVLDDNPDDYYALVNRAMLRMRSLRLDEAQADVNRALKTDPRGAAALLVQGEIYARRGENTKAIEAFRNLLAFSPQPVAYAELGELESQNGDLDQALHDYGKATELGNDKPAWLDTYNRLRDQRNKKRDQEAAQKKISESDKSGAK